MRLPQFVNGGQERENLLSKHSLKRVNALKGFFGSSVCADDIAIEDGGTISAVKDSSGGLHFARGVVASNGLLGRDYLGGSLAHDRGHPAKTEMKKGIY